MNKSEISRLSSHSRFLEKLALNCFACLEFAEAKMPKEGGGTHIKMTGILVVLFRG